MLSTWIQRFQSASDSPSMEHCRRSRIPVVSQRACPPGVLVLLAFLLAGCGNKHVASAPVPAPVAGGSASASVSRSTPNAGNADRSSREPSSDPDEFEDAIERGQASWYGNPYHGRMAASGEIYDMEELTAAHRSLPFHTWVEVTNLSNGKKVQVRITDRGPFIDGRIIDLSRAAAREIDMLRAGVVPVELRIVDAPDASLASIDLHTGSAPQQDAASDPQESAATSHQASTNQVGTHQAGTHQTGAAEAGALEAGALDAGAGFVVQAGAFRFRDGAMRVRDRIASRLPDANARIVARDVAAGDGDQGIVWRVLVGEDLSRPEAVQLAEEVSAISGEALVTAE